MKSILIIKLIMLFLTINKGRQYKMTNLKNEKNISLYGEGEFIYFHEKDNAFGDPGEYKVTLKVPKANAGEYIREINSVIAKQVGPGDIGFVKSRKPYVVKGDYVHFKAHSQFKPTIWNKDQTKLTDKVVWKGSTMWVNCRCTGYSKAIGSGATLLMGPVQIDKLVEGTGAPGADRCPFPNRAVTESVLPVKEVANG